MRNRVKYFVLLITFILVFSCMFASYTIFAQERIKIPAMNFTTAGTTGSWFPIGAVIVDNVNKKYFEGYPINAIAGEGGVSNPSRVGIGEEEVKFGFTYSTFAKNAIEGKPPYDKAYPNIKAICSLTINVYHFVAAENLNLTKISDVKDGKIKLNFGTGPAGSTELFTSEVLFSEMGLNLVDDIMKWGGKVEAVSNANRDELWQNRHIDVYTSIQVFPSASVTQILMARPGKIIEIDKDLRDNLINKWGYINYTIPSGSYRGQDNPVETIGMSMIIIARSDVPDNVAYLLTKAIAEMKDDLVNTNASFKTWEPEMMPKGVGIEIHPGALQYYKERGWL